MFYCKESCQFVSLQSTFIFSGPRNQLHKCCRRIKNVLKQGVILCSPINKSHQTCSRQRNVLLQRYIDLILSSPRNQFHQFFRRIRNVLFQGVIFCSRAQETNFIKLVGEQGIFRFNILSISSILQPK